MLCRARPLLLLLTAIGCGNVTAVSNDAGGGSGGQGTGGAAGSGGAGTGGSEVDGGAMAATWTTTASALTGPPGGTVAFTCPAGGTPAAIWGTEAYTGDSAVCTAAVHAGLLTLADGGSATLQMLGGLARYTGSASHGITSRDKVAFPSTFRFPAATTWKTTAAAFRGLLAARLPFICSAGGAAAMIWGTDVYTDDSPVCTAAVHAGRFTLAAAGSVTVELAAAQPMYTGSTRNGVTSMAYRPGVGVPFGSYVFPK